MTKTRKRVHPNGFTFFFMMKREFWFDNCLPLFDYPWMLCYYFERGFYRRIYLK